MKSTPNNYLLENFTISSKVNSELLNTFDNNVACFECELVYLKQRNQLILLSGRQSFFDSKMSDAIYICNLDELKSWFAAFFTF